MESRSNVLCELFAAMIKEPFFSTLRTKEQLGRSLKSLILNKYRIITKLLKSVLFVEHFQYLNSLLLKIYVWFPFVCH